MDPYNNWDADGLTVKAVPMPHEDFEQYFTEYNEIDNLFNETLTGLQDLDVPSGFVTHDIKQHQPAQSHPQTPKHGRQASGTAIFGFSDHNRELSIGGLATDLYKAGKGLVDFGKSISPGELSNAVSANMEFNFSNAVDIPGRIHLNEEDEYKEPIAVKGPEKENKSDYIVTNQNPKSYKFPPSSPPPAASGNFQNVNNYSAKYLKDLGKLNSNKGQPETAYVDDIEPLLERDMYQSFANNMPKQLTPFHLSTVANGGGLAAPNTIYKYVPVPVQDPAVFQQNFIKNGGGVFLPPPSPPTLSNGSPEYQSLPEPQSPSPSRSSLNQGFYSATRTVNPAVHQASSPIQANKAQFYNPQFFSDQPGNPFSSGESLAFNQLSPRNLQQLSPVHPGSSISSSPVKYYSPLRNLQPTNDDTVDANATITQLTPLKNQFPTTPSRSKIQLEWSPIISPNAKANRDVKAAIQSSSPRRRIKKISLLPSGRA